LPQGQEAVASVGQVIVSGDSIATPFGRLAVINYGRVDEYATEDSIVFLFSRIDTSYKLPKNRVSVLMYPMRQLYKLPPL